METYHIYSNHLERSLLFYGDEDRIVFTNQMALLVRSLGIRLYAYCLMDNHVHLLASARPEAIEELFAKLRYVHSRHLAGTRSGDANLKGFTPEMRQVTSVREFKAVTAYILRNPLAAGIASPVHYRWSSAFLYFNPSLPAIMQATDKPVRTTKIQAAVHTRKDIPDGWTLWNGVLSPWEWCDYRCVERYFGRSIDFHKALSNWNAERECEAALDSREMNAYTDAMLVPKVAEYCHGSGASNCAGLDTIDLRNLVTMLHQRYGASKKQIARLTGADSDTIDRFY